MAGEFRDLTRQAERHEFVIEADGNVRLDLLVAAKLDLSRTQAATLIANGNVSVNDRREKASYKPVRGERILVDRPAESAREIVGENIPLRVVFEDESLLVVDKPAGMVVHPAPGNWSGTLVNALLGRGGALAPGASEERAGIVHRLDKETSGLLIVAKSERAHRLLSSAIAARRVTRRYAVMIWGHLTGDSLTIDKPVARDPRDRTRMAIVSNGRQARTDFLRLARFGPGDLLRAHLHSGRTHQIRVHLASVGHPVMGDDVYGGGGGRRIVGLSPRRHFLHAAWLRFDHPVTGASMDIRSPLPDDLRRSLQVIGEDAAVAQAEDPLAALGFHD
ncbi:MAG TPA: RluA family pseudouridine synthase [Gemmatimonadaceae bacterium]|nr:RluA family pseudouridine synthase [Gemmatimonadaceae bacterium]